MSYTFFNQKLVDSESVKGSSYSWCKVADLVGHAVQSRYLGWEVFLAVGELGDEDLVGHTYPPVEGDRSVMELVECLVEFLFHRLVGVLWF